MSKESELPEEPDEKTKWKQLVVTPDDGLPPPVCKSTFKIKFPQYREKYLRAAWPEVNKVLDKFGIKGSLDLVEGEMRVDTTRKVWDPWSIVSARDFVHLLARSVPLLQATKIFNDEITCDIVKLGKGRISKEKYVKRRQRVVGPNGSTLKALEILTNCFIMVQGNTVSIMGPHKGVDEAQEIIRGCMNNVHPIYKLKELMIKRELEKNPALANEDWSRFLPKFKKKNVKRKKPKKIRKKKAYTPFPPEQKPSIIDEQLMSGEYWMSEQKRLKEKRRKQKDGQIEKTKERKRKRKAAFQPPKEIKRQKVEKKQRSAKEIAEKLKKKKQEATSYES